MNKITEDFIEQNNRFEMSGTSSKEYTDTLTNNLIDTKGIANSTAKVVKRKSKDSLTYPGKIVYEANYSFDSYGLRTTPLNHIPNRKPSIFFGDAQTFGEGLNDNQTLPSFFQTNSEKFNSFNYGFPGHGPTNMLGWLRTFEFQSKFRNVEGEIFYIFRDNAIRRVNSLEESITPDKFTNKDFDNTIKVLENCNKIIKNISSNLNFTIVILPLSFSSRQLTDLILEKGLNVINLYNIDLSYLTDNKSRYLDGIHTAQSNNIISKYLISYYQTGYCPSYFFDNFSTEDYSIMMDRVALESFFMSYFIDYPVDDAGVVISYILKKYKGIYNDEKILNLSQKSFEKKMILFDSLYREKVIPKNTYDLFISNNLKVNKEKLYNNKFFKKLSQEYKNYFIKIYIDLYEQTQRLQSSRTV